MITVANAGNTEVAAKKANEETVAIRVFLGIVALVLVAAVAAFAMFGLAGVGVVAVIEAALMLVLCVVLTRG